MRRLVSVVFILVASTMQGCSGSPARTDSALSSLQLFGSGGQPRFSVDLACAGLEPTSDAQCITVDNAFLTWSHDRRVKLRTTTRDNPAFQPEAIKARLQSASSTVPYLVVVRVEPQVEPSFRDAGNGTPMFGSGGNSGSVGYRAWIRVFSTATGTLVQKESLHHQQAMPDHANITPAFEAEVDRVIHTIDSAYPD